MARKNRTRNRSTPGTGPSKPTPADDVVLAGRYLIAASVAVVSIVMSYQALADLGHRGHIAPQWRWVWPYIFVAPEIGGALAVIAAQFRRQGAAWSWFLLITATAVSVAANVAAAPNDPISQIAHGIVPVVGFVQVKDLCIGIRKRLEAAAEAEAASAPAEVPATPERRAAPEPVVIHAPVDEPAFPVPPKPTAAPGPAPVPGRTEQPAASALRSVPKTTEAKGTKERAIDRHAELARQWIAEEPEISGSEIGRRLGKSDRYGRNVLAAATA